MSADDAGSMEMRCLFDWNRNVVLVGLHHVKSNSMKRDEIGADLFVIAKTISMSRLSILIH